MADCVSQHLRAQGKALVSTATSSTGMFDADGNPLPGTSSGGVATSGWEFQIAFVSNNTTKILCAHTYALCRTY